MDRKFRDPKVPWDSQNLRTLHLHVRAPKKVPAFPRRLETQRAGDPEIRGPKFGTRVRDFDRSADRSIDRSGKEKKIKEGKASPHPRVTRTRDAASSDRGIDLAGGEDQRDRRIGDTDEG
jgi:hypothetical protein